MKDFDNIIAEVLDYAERDGNTLVVVSADHETGGLTMPSAGGGKLRHEFSTGGHTAQHVPVFSFGPQSERFAGRYDNTDIAKKIFSIWRSEEHTSELQSRGHLVCRLLLEKKKN